MRLSLAIAAATIVVAAASAAAAGPAHSTSVHVAVCQLSPARTERAVTYVSTMNAVPGTDRMAMRFTLRVHAPGQRTASVRSPALSTWRRSHTGVQSFTYTQTVNGLARTGVYRVVVEYRWTDASGRVLRTAWRVSPVCSELGPLNDLQIARVTAHPAAEAGTALYDFDLVNDGPSAERNLRLSLYVDRAPGGTAPVDSLAPHATTTVELTGETCVHAVHLVVAHPGDQQRSMLGWRCPAVP